LILAPGSEVLAGDASDVNVISKVEVRGTAVEIAGNRKPNFTTFTMTDPPRLVVDISEAVFSHVPEEIRVQNGTIRAIKTAGYGSGASAIARVIIGFERNVETDIANLGENSLLVKILGEGGTAVAEAEKPAASPRAAAERSGNPSTVALASGAKERVPAVAQKAEPAKPEVARANKEAELEKRQREQEEAKKREAEAKRAAELKAEEEARQKRLAEVEEKKRLENEERAAQAKAKEERLRQAAEEKQKKQEEARLAKELEREKANAEEERRKQAASEKQKKLEEARLAKQIEAQERAKADEERRRQVAAEKQSKQEAALLAQRLEHERANAENHRQVGVKVAKASSAQSDADEPPQIRRRSAAAHSLVTFVGFTHEPSGSRVFVRTTGPVQYSVAEGKDKTVILELENARIALRNNTRALDTSQFDSAVAMVEPNQAAAETVRVQIRLKDSVPYRAKQEGNEVILDFGPPAHP
jgi:colicin import membrane protein